MGKRFAYFYFMRHDPVKIQSVAPAHVAYWRSHGLSGYMGGPFADRSGGMISFEAETLDAVMALVADDPFVRQDLLETRWVKEWAVE